MVFLREKIPLKWMMTVGTLQSAENDMDGGVGVAGAWSAEIQSLGHEMV